MKTIVCCSFKGGTGKTTVCLNLGAALASIYGKKVLVVDFDPQANLSRGLGFGPEEKNTMMPILQEIINIKEGIQSSYLKNLDVIVSNKYLVGVEKTNELISDPYSHERLGEKLKAVHHEYDYCFIDIPPSFGWLCQSAFYASDFALICSELSPYSIDVLTDLKAYLHEVNLRHPIDILGVVLSFWYSKGADNEDLLGYVEELFPEKLFQTRIRRDVLVQRCIFEGKAVFDLDEKSRGSEDYQKLAQEFFQKEQMLLGV